MSNRLILSPNLVRETGEHSVVPRVFLPHPRLPLLPNSEFVFDATLRVALVLLSLMCGLTLTLTLRATASCCAD